MKFFIKQNSTLPVLKFPLTEKLMKYYNITEKMLENIGVTFSMTDEKGNYIIANKPAEYYVKSEDEYEYLSDAKYNLLYKFTQRNTKNAGFFYGEFKLDFLDDDNNCNKITLPNTSKIDIIILKSSTHTTVI
jgi:hypothetical protein